MSCSRRYSHDVMETRQRGVVLLLTIVILVVLSVLSYTVSIRVAAHRHRADFMINYTKAQYACDSALKCMLESLDQINMTLVSRPNEPDFSDLFAMDQETYEAYLSEWYGEDGMLSDTNQVQDTEEEDGTEPNTNESLSGNPNENKEQWEPLEEPLYGIQEYIVRGPYGPVWPYVQEPLDFQIGQARVQIGIEDENAKYPLGLMLSKDQANEREIEAGFVSFCEWMQMTPQEIDEVAVQLEELNEIQPYKTEFKMMTVPDNQSATGSSAAARLRRSRNTNRGRKPISPDQQKAQQDIDLTRLLNSTALDKAVLAGPLIQTDTRTESALKYIGLNTMNKVNINTAPRHVLEAVLMFGGDAVDIADLIIEQRRIEPITDLENLKKTLFRYDDAIEKDKPYLCTQSTTFTVRVEATCGVAKASKVVVLMRNEDGGFKKLAVVSG